MTKASRRFVRDSRGGVAVEFVALVPAFLFLTFFVLEIGIAVLWVGTVEKAAQLGARLAIVSNRVVTGLPATYSRTTGYNWGQNCSAGACDPDGDGLGFTTKTCGGGSGEDCDTVTCLNASVTCFNVVVNRMRDIASVIQPSHVTMTYEYVGLGYAGGPIIPRVTVTLQGVPYNTFTTSILAGLMTMATGSSDFPGLTIMPTITASFTGEDLSTAGAS